MKCFQFEKYMPLICIKRIEKQKQGYKRFTLMVQAFSFMTISRKL